MPKVGNRHAPDEDRINQIIRATPQCSGHGTNDVNGGIRPEPGQTLGGVVEVRLGQTLRRHEIRAGSSTPKRKDRKLTTWSRTASVPGGTSVSWCERSTPDRPWPAWPLSLHPGDWLREH